MHRSTRQSSKASKTKQRQRSNAGRSNALSSKSSSSIMSLSTTAMNSSPSMVSKTRVATRVMSSPSSVTIADNSSRSVSSTARTRFTMTSPASHNLKFTAPSAAVAGFMKPTTTTAVIAAPTKYRQRRQMSSQINNVADTHLTSNNAAYIDAMYENWKHDPSSVHKSWATYFKTGKFVSPPDLTPSGMQVSRDIGASASTTRTGGGVGDNISAKMAKVVNDFRKHGHLQANVDPLGIQKTRGADDYRALLTNVDVDPNATVDLSSVSPIFKQPMTAADVIKKCEKVYSDSVGVEFEHVSTEAERQWLYNRFETMDEAIPLTKEKKQVMLNQLGMAHLFENFLKQKYNVKRFGLEGGEAAIVGLQELLSTSSEHGAETCVMGMPHRGRLNVLTNVVGKPLEVLLSEFAGNYDADTAQSRKDGVFVTNYDEFAYAGDVKYHHGWSAVNKLPNGKQMNVTMLPNPSHLETVNPLVMGKTRAKQQFTGDEDQSKVFSIVLHGDAAFAGQGVVYETMAMHGLKGYSIGGTIHYVINNQVGFTTNPYDSRSGVYSTDVAKAFNAPVFHVNGDDVDAVNRVSKIAAEYRAQFKKDVVIDLICYRLHGHNELDQPSFTQPLMYQNIAKHENVYSRYKQKLLQSGEFTAEQLDGVDEQINEHLRTKFDEAKEYKGSPNEGQSLQGNWSAIAKPSDPVETKPTGLDTGVLKNLGTQIATIPEDITLHRGIGNAYKDKKARVEEGQGLDWATCEALAFSSLLCEGYPVRIAGQDAQRGTFSHRHAVVHDQPTGKTYTPLHNLENPLDKTKKPAKFTVINSLLSEYAALGFEAGYSWENPNQLVIWEAQFGDFVNGAQTVIDNFLSAGEYKWGKMSNLVMLLPHGYEGQGAEHSSARMERFLQSSNDDAYNFPTNESDENARQHRANWRVMNMTTAANYYHALRRQVHSNIRKPMIVMSPKSLLRSRDAASTYEDMSPQTSFQEVIGDHKHGNNSSSADQVQKHILCSGKVYYEIIDQLEKNNVRDKVAVTRVEQIAPFPFKQVQQEDQKYKNSNLFWVQEEHMNMGAFSYVAPRIETAVADHRGKAFKTSYIGRPPAAAAATGSPRVHEAELKQFMSEVVKL